MTIIVSVLLTYSSLRTLVTTICLSSRTSFVSTAAIDIAEDKLGRDLGDVLGLPHRLDLIVQKDAGKSFAKAKPDIVVHATSSSLKQVYSLIIECIRSGTNVVSTCEERVYPYQKNKAIARRLGRLAEKHGVSVLGTGINPGFLMDTLPITVTGTCLDVKHVKITRMTDSSKRRIPYQEKIGTGLSQQEFKKKIGKEITGHVGLNSSIAMIADSLGWMLDDMIELPPEPVIAKRIMKTAYTTVEEGLVAGLKSRAYGIVDDKKAIELEFVSHAGVDEEYDMVEIDGVPKIRLKIEGGVHGDVGTSAMTVNSILKVMNAPPGLHTMNRLLIPSGTPLELNRYVR